MRPALEMVSYPWVAIIAAERRATAITIAMAIFMREHPCMEPTAASCHPMGRALTARPASSRRSLGSTRAPGALECRRRSAGWYRQQVIKWEVTALLRFGGYLTLDCDACCVGDFDATTFIKSGRALSGWEPKRHHEWWRHAADFVGIPYDPAAHGLSVTPNVLHSDLARQTLEFVGLGAIDSHTALRFRLLRKIGQIAWTA